MPTESGILKQKGKKKVVHISFIVEEHKMRFFQVATSFFFIDELLFAWVLCRNDINADGLTRISAPCASKTYMVSC